MDDQNLGKPMILIIQLYKIYIRWVYKTFYGEIRFSIAK